MKKLLLLTLVVLGIGANVLACGACSARRTAPPPPANQNK